MLRMLSPHELVRIREIDRSEILTHLYRVVDGNLVGYPVHIDVPNWETSEPDHQHGVQQRIDKWQNVLRSGGTLIGAENGDRLAGFAIFRPYLTSEMGELTALFVSRPYRRQGLARRLVAAVEELARQTRSRQLYVSATPSDSAVGFYIACGFAPARIPHPERFAAEPEDIHMVKDL